MNYIEAKTLFERARDPAKGKVLAAHTRFVR